jgi:ferrous iron transport protein A
MAPTLIPLAKLAKNQAAIVRKIDETRLPRPLELNRGELEQRILEIGIVENTQICVRHFGLIKRDPIAIEINNGLTIAIRRNEAQIIMVEPITK